MSNIQIRPYITAIKMALAATIAFVLYNLFHFEYGYWSVVTIAAITQAGVSKTLTKSLMRCLGTIVGAIIGYLFAILAQGNTEIVLILFFIFIVFSSYITILPGPVSYAGVITGLTMVIVLSSSLLTGELIGMAVYRSAEVLLGILIMAIINLIIWFWISQNRDTLQSFYHVSINLPNHLRKINFSRSQTIAAIKIALACLFTFAIWVYFRQPGGFWATISCLLIMEENIHQTHIKSFMRFWAHVAAALFGGICALLLGHYVWLLLIPLVISYLFCGYLIGKQNQYSSLGNTMGIAITIMLLTSPGTDSTLQIISARFLNVTFGIIVAIVITRYFPISQHNQKAKEG